MLMSFLLVLLVLSITGTISVSAQLTINTLNGPVQGAVIYSNGVNTASQVRLWSRIPFAQPPINGNRWKKPQPVLNWTSPITTDPTLPAVGCPQSVSSDKITISEDCLYLNVIAPNQIPSTPLPVMVYIYGGSYKSGAGGAFNGAGLVAENNVIFVSLNYRLGFLGFGGSAALAAETDGVFGNYGFLDQRAALQWVQANIASFGGNPNSITIWGQSAGALSVSAHLTSPLSLADNPPLFHRAILHSLYEGPSFLSKSSTEFLFQQMILQTSCASTPTLACLRQLPWSAFSSSPIVNYLFIFSLTIDGTVIADSARNQLTLHNWMKVPILIGTNADEYAYFLCAGGFDQSYTSFSLTTYFEAISVQIDDPILIQTSIANYIQSPIAATYRPNLFFGI